MGPYLGLIDEYTPALLSAVLKEVQPAFPSESITLAAGKPSACRDRLWRDWI
jgi:hypothetical protein